jgi:hypothetical protein
MTRDAGKGRVALHADDSVRVLELSPRVQRRLQRAGINTVGDLVVQREGDLLTMAGFGGASLSEVKRKLARYGLGMGQRVRSGPAAARSPAPDATAMGLAAGLAANAALASQFKPLVRGGRVVDDYVDMVAEAASRLTAAMRRREQ